MKRPATKSAPGKILVVENDPDMAASIEMILGASGEGHAITLCDDGAKALALATLGSDEANARGADRDTGNGNGNGNGGFDLVLTDFRLPGIGGLDLLQRLRENEPQRPVILMTANGNTELAIEASKRGAYDYLVKPFDIDELVDVTTQALRASQTMRKRVRMGATSGGQNQSSMIGNCQSMQKVYKEIGRFAPTDVTVLILGETGTGKELVARAIYQHSRRADKPFVAVNCGAIPENLLESELFGHVRGAFTGATADRVGRFQQADGGTLFLDEIGDIPVPVQVKLLRVLQEGTVQPLGSSVETKVNVRIIAATHQPLVERIAEDRFREDLYYRINSAIIKLPPLRDRGDDLTVLINHFINVASENYHVPCPELPKPVMKRLASHPWPGNIRELSNVVGRLVLRSRGYPVSVELAEAALKGGGIDAAVALSGEQETRFALAIIDPVRAALEEARKLGSGEVHENLVSDLERRLISTALELASGHLGNVASWLGISRVTLRKKIALYGLADQPSK